MDELQKIIDKIENTKYNDFENQKNDFYYSNVNFFNNKEE